MYVYLTFIITISPPMSMILEREIVFLECFSVCLWEGGRERRGGVFVGSSLHIGVLLLFLNLVKTSLAESINSSIGLQDSRRFIDVS